MKLLVSDYDVTIVENETVSPQVLELINTIHNDDNSLFAIATGRSYQDLIDSTNALRIPYDYALTLNGSIITNNNGEIIRERTIPNDIVEKGLLAMAEVMKYHKIVAMVSTKEGRHAFYNQQEIKEYLNNFRNHNEKYYGLGLDCISHDIAEAEPVAHILRECNIENCEIVKCLFYVDIMFDGISKSDAISYIEQMHDINSANLYVIGDSYNDMSMFNNTKNSFTFHNSPQEVKEAATYHVDSIIECLNMMLNH